jgi:hypothetical protein
MSFKNNDDLSIEWWIAEAAELISVREGLQKRHSNLVILENLSEWIGYYELSLSPKSAYSKFRSSSV